MCACAMWREALPCAASCAWSASLEGCTARVARAGASWVARRVARGACGIARRGAARRAAPSADSAVCRVLEVDCSELDLERCCHLE